MYIGYLANILTFRDNLPKSGAAEEKCYAFIKQHPRCMQKAIVDALDTDKGSVSRAVAKLIERGLVEKDQRDALMATS